MAREREPGGTDRAEAFSLWMQAPMPMVTIFKTLDVTRLVRARRRSGGFNLLMCWCIGRAAAADQGVLSAAGGRRLMEYDRLAVNTVVATAAGGIATCDLPVSDSLAQFREDYLRLTRQVRETGRPHELGDEYMVVGTSALAGFSIDGAVNLYAGIYNNPFLIWGRYRGGALRATLPISFQFHHVQMDGVPAARFLERLQQEIRRAPL